MTQLTPELARFISPLSTAVTLSAGLAERYMAARHLRYISQRITSAIYKGGARLMVFAPPRHGKPVEESALILMGDGSRIPLRDVKVGDRVITHLGRSRRVSHVFEQGLLPVFKLSTWTSRSVEAAEDHPFLSCDGWKELKDLRTGMWLAERPEANTEATSFLRSEECRLLGYFTGDGNVTQSESATTCNSSITCFDDLQEQDIYTCCNVLGFAVRKDDKVKGRLHINGGSREWLRSHGVAGKGSWTKLVPKQVLTSGAEAIANFIGAYFACDGSINVKGKKRKDHCIEFYSVAKELLEGVQHCLLRLGMQSRLCEKKGRYKGAAHKSWRLSLNSRRDVTRFIDTIPVYGVKRDRLAAWRQPMSDFIPEFLPDEIMSIEATGLKQCRCLTVEEDETFTANDFVVHNSQLLSKFTPVWHLERWPTKKIINAGYGKSFATDWGRQVRNLVNENSDLLSIKLAADSQKQEEFHTDQGGAMLCVGVGSGVTGKGADCILVDDPIKGFSEASSWTHREGVWNWWKTEARTRLHPGGSIIMTLARWSEDDLAGRLLKAAANDPNADQWDVIALPAEYDAKAAQLLGPCPLGRSIGEVLWPEMWPMSELKAHKSNTIAWESLYQCRPGNTADVGNVYSNFKENRHVRRDLPYDPYQPFFWALDFNVNPMCTAYGQYTKNNGLQSALTGRGSGQIRVLGELCLPETTTREVCEAFEGIYRRVCRGDRKEVEIYGDASGNFSHTSQTSGTDYDIIKTFLKSKGIPFKMCVQARNPAVKDRTNAVNDVCFEPNGLLIAESCKMLIKDLNNVRWKCDLNGNTIGVMDKSQTDLTHISDAWGYMAWRVFGKAQGFGEQSGSIF